MSIMCRIDDKLVPLYRVMWVSAVPHFCGEEDCTREGCYEIRLEQGESVWGNTEDRDKICDQLEQWQGGLGPTDETDETDDGDGGPW
ncbi:MAG: hypothetical protein GXP26_05750 [Planctomycetes bacterium]|nr:hypothetical protein [Planctomycetota bacterium]